MPSGLDQSWSFANPAAAKAAGVQVVSMYLSYDQSKNITPGKVKAYHKVGVASLLNWESQAGAPLRGAAQGHADATEAVRQARALIAGVGYRPGNRLTIYFSCDTDVSGSQISGPVAAYYRNAATVCHAAGFGVGCYGEADLVHYLAGNHITDSEWQTLAWSYGRVDPATDFYQSGINDYLGGASVDYDRVIHPASLGAWWPTNSPYNKPGGPLPPTHPEWSDMATQAQVQAACAAAIKQELTAIQGAAGRGVLYNKQPNETGHLSYIVDHIRDTHNRMRDTVMPALAKINARLLALETKESVK